MILICGLKFSYNYIVLFSAFYRMNSEKSFLFHAFVQVKFTIPKQILTIFSAVSAVH